ncbi:hypothetical protein [Paenibacillus agricola]|uniref:Uncharacterized protein n=1 Tax=Paenibacillus agricola TaxID=2716264 RepID=A0ABX0JB99_9BACL|nr:hypothetical protein [Paenibacillus agricola]NHN33689.1 hypothetical protein [Paenibacillus agricola]
MQLSTDPLFLYELFHDLFQVIHSPLFTSRMIPFAVDSATGTFALIEERYHGHPHNI